LANSKSLGWLSFCATPRKYGIGSETRSAPLSRRPPIRASSTASEPPSAFQETSAQVLALETAQTGAQEQLRVVFSKLHRAETDLRDLGKTEPSTVAWDFALGETTQRGLSQAALRRN
jgi:hypothetical protein